MPVTGLSLEEGQQPPPPVNEEFLAQQGTGYLRQWHTPAGQPRLLPGAVTDYTTGYLLAFGTLVALYRRATEGGSYVVRCSLTQSGMCVERMGRADADEARLQPEFPPAEILEKLCIERDTAFGRIRFLGPVVHMSETPARWDLPVVPRGTHQPVWLDRHE
jgi:crotonobetainyl-CoA:carnitine CoA-transferase CaiB-like acyl-CoA transferase